MKRREDQGKGKLSGYWLWAKRGKLLEWCGMCSEDYESDLLVSEGDVSIPDRGDGVNMDRCRCSIA